MPTLSAIREIISDWKDENIGDDELVDLFNEIVVARNLPFQQAGTATAVTYAATDLRVMRFFAAQDITIRISAWSEDAFVSTDREPGRNLGDGRWISQEEYDASSTCDFCDTPHPADSTNRTSLNRIVCDDCRSSRDLVWLRGENCYRDPEDEDEPEDEPNDDDDEPDEPAAVNIMPFRRYPTVSQVLAGHPNQYPVDVLNYTTNVLLLRPFAAFCVDEAEAPPAFPLWLGVELEVVPRRMSPGSSRLVDPAYKGEIHDATSTFAIMKKDGSLDDGGVEIVSVPATLYAHYRLWHRFFEGTNRCLTSYHNKSCGMHVHIARDALTEMQIGKMLVFVNSHENTAFIAKVAGRSDASYAVRSPKKVADVKPGRVHRHHYDALSFSEHTKGKSVELRIFRGNVSKAGFFKNLEFTHAMTVFCLEASMQKLSGDDFLAWLNQPERRAVYPYLTAWAVRESLIQARVRRSIGIDFTESEEAA